MAENTVDISVSVPSSGHSINVFVPGSTGEVTARDNLAETYAEWARLWAIKEGDKVNGEDYSSKHYATEAKNSALEAQYSEQNCQMLNNALVQNYNSYSEELTELSNSTIEEIEEISNNTVASITELSQNTLNTINETGANTVANLTETAETAKSDITNLKVDSLAEITNTGNTIINDFNSSAQDVITKITATGATGLEVSYDEENKTLVFSDLEYMKLAEKLDEINGEVV